MVVVVLVLLSILLQQVFDNYIATQQLNELSHLARTVVTVVAHTDSAVSQQLALQLSKTQKATVTVLFPNNRELPVVLEHLNRQQRSLLNQGSSLVLHTTTSGGSPTISVYLQVPSKTTSTSLVIVSQHTSVLIAPITRMRNLILFAMILGVILTTGLAFVVSNNLSHPLIQMNRAAEGMSRGHFTARVQVVTHDEVGRLGRTFNLLANELERTIAALSRERDLLSLILSSLEDGVFAVDLHGKVTLANPPGLRKLDSLLLLEEGPPESSALPQSLLKLVHQVLKNNTAIKQELVLLGRNIAVIIQPLYQVDGNTLRGTIGVLRDVTEERKLDRLRKDFLANVSHELRTPLSLMQGYTEALLDEFGDNPQQRFELTQIIHDETMRMKRLVNDLLDLAQLQSGQFQMNFEQIDLTDLTQRIAHKFHALAVEHGLSLSMDILDHPLYICADGDRMEQVYTNLLDNGMRHTQDGGQVRITLNEMDAHVQIRFSDTGSGIPAEDIPYIWERFYKADKSRKRGTAGIGLGLSITRQIVLEHGGDIIVSSKLGVGTTFTVMIPKELEKCSPKT
ncbi:HAMP domain-containing protein [Alicyclobacillaceae bacterium I2511]|nr:HAMP domain-containing protein [Alicyclobacillaceae bacterium I2511]